MMEQHNELQMYVGFAEGGCQDVATVKLEGFTLVDSKQLAALIAERDALRRLAEFRSEKATRLSAYCQANNIGNVGDWCVDALINHCDALAAKLATCEADTMEREADAIITAPDDSGINWNSNIRDHYKRIGATMKVRAAIARAKGETK